MRCFARLGRRWMRGHDSSCALHAVDAVRFGGVLGCAGGWICAGECADTNRGEYRDCAHSRRDWNSVLSVDRADMGLVQVPPMGRAASNVEETMNVAQVRKVTVVPLPDKRSVRSIRLDFACANQSEPIRLELPARLAKGVAEAIFEVLRAGNSPPPPSPVPEGRRKKPKLWIVK